MRHQMLNLLVVESPAKAKTINKYLGDEFVVLSSFGHTHDLPSKNGSIIPEEDFRMIYEVSEKAQKPLQEILKYAKKSQYIYLATDLDREGEAIAWHIAEEIKNVAFDKPIVRIRFSEITKSAILNALKSPEQINIQLVNAQQTRRALDYLMGFNLSPLLWKKIPSAKSAGRVQSVALRLIYEREVEREKFEKQEYWTIEVDIANQNKTLNIVVFEYQKKKLKKFDLVSKEEAAKLIQILKKSNSLTCTSVKTHPYKRKPYAPFITSTLQQDAIHKLGFSASQTMKIAQELYEGIKIQDEQTGLITYMRTDSTFMSKEAVQSICDLIKKQYGSKFIPDKINKYKKGLNTQEAHECIRPVNFALEPKNIQEYLSINQYKLYLLIWNRAVASQMANAEYATTTIEFHNDNADIGLKTSINNLLFPGFTIVYDQEQQTKEEIQQQIQEKSIWEIQKIKDLQHFTEPPAQFTEASLVKNLEELGIGRPSTYASILDVIIRRNYVELKGKKFIPTPIGRLVAIFLSKFFPNYVNYNFTAYMENKLDEIAIGKVYWKESLEHFWQCFKKNVDEVQATDNQTITEVISKEMNVILTSMNLHKCTNCGKDLNLKLSRFGLFIGCSGYPNCKFTKNLQDTNDIESSVKSLHAPNQTTSILVGKYGPYLQLVKTDGSKQNISLPSKLDPKKLTPKLIKIITQLPQEIGTHPETGLPILLGINKVGFYLLVDNKYHSVNLTELEGINLEKALVILNRNKKKQEKPKSISPS